MHEDTPFTAKRTLRAVLAASLLFANSVGALAQSGDATQLQIPGAGGFGGVERGPALPFVGTQQVRLSAQLTAESPELTRGLIWRIFKPDAGDDGKLPLVVAEQGGTRSFDLAPGSYLVHAAFGRAGATKRITVGNEPRMENFVLDAGGLKLDAMLSDGMRIAPSKVRFDVMEGTEGPDGERAMIAPQVRPNSVVRLNAGVYHVVSYYGQVNAVIRSDIRIDPGKLTVATVEHKAAQLSMKLVRASGGEAIADTAWSVLTDSGDVVRESVGPFAAMVLAEGDYTVIANNRDRIYQRSFTVRSGQDEDIELITSRDIADIGADGTEKAPVE
ncbi:hypothetical protein EJC49_10610 [Aquibium carbonis]|uniref:Carboxypeptidase regulatory-like domain-containing protein n=1 Tax=Aquibium carbonis TaxID=2495581 RepID=A0A3R9YFI1_9HYPH|nr:hypothetical protein [Aquibium carbonis]RST86428.1 hypothetical protein EJC49_10610 [Aquibium carbonis]